MNLHAADHGYNRFNLMLDEDIVDYARKGDAEALEYLIYKYKNFVKAKARSYFLIGADRKTYPGRNDRVI